MVLEWIGGSRMDSDTQKILAEALLEIKELSSKVDALSAQLSGVTSISGWASPNEAAIALKPDGVQSAGHLKALRLRGAFSDKDVRKKGRRWEYNIEKCRSSLATYFRRQSAAS